MRVRLILFIVNFIIADCLVSVIFLFVTLRLLLKFTMRKNRLNTVYASDSIHQERLPASLEVDRIYF